MYEDITWDAAESKIFKHVCNSHLLDLREVTSIGKVRSAIDLRFKPQCPSPRY